MVRVVAAAIVLGFFAGPAWANSGIGFLFPAIPALILALVPVILLEAPVLAGILRLPQWKCRTPDLPQRYAPYGCRDRDNEGK